MPIDSDMIRIDTISNPTCLINCFLLHSFLNEYELKGIVHILSQLPDCCGGQTRVFYENFSYHPNRALP